MDHVSAKDKEALEAAVQELSPEDRKAVEQQLAKLYEPIPDAEVQEGEAEAAAFVARASAASGQDLMAEGGVVSEQEPPNAVRGPVRSLFEEFAAEHREQGGASAGVTGSHSRTRDLDR